MISMTAEMIYQFITQSDKLIICFYDIAIKVIYFILLI